MILVLYLVGIVCYINEVKKIKKYIKLTKTMKYHSKQYLYQPVQEQDFVHYYSFVKKPSAYGQHRIQRPQNITKNNLAVFTDDLNDTVPFNKPNLVKKRQFFGRDLTRNNHTLLRKNNCDRLQNKSLYQLSIKNKSSFGQAQLKSVSIKDYKKEQQSDQVYKKIIKILQNENRNLKEHNKFLLTQYKNIQESYSQLKQQIDSSNNNSDDIETEIQKLSSMSIAYEKQIQQLKNILLDQIVAIHQKFRLVLSGDELSQGINQLTDALKKSQMIIDNAQFQSLDEKLKNIKSPRSNRKMSGIVFSQLLSFQEDEIAQKQSSETLETLNKENYSNASNYDFSVMQSPTETIFAGQIGLSTQFKKPNNKGN